VDDKFEYLHVLKAPAGGANTLKLPPPADGKKFSKAVLLAEKKPIALKQDESGLSLSLPTGSSWDRINTVIALQVSADSPPQNLALWKSCGPSSHLDHTRHPAMATDGNPATAWASDPQDGNPWLALDLGTTRTIARMELEGNFLPGDRIAASQSFDFSKAETVATYQGASVPQVEILSASYGAGNSRADLTEKLRQSVKGGSLRIIADNSLAGGDPAPNHPKELHIEYKQDGKQATKVVKEGEVLALGQIEPWRIDLGKKPAFRHLRVERVTAGQPMQVAEWRVFAPF
jgi:hypothetical protein